jgi:hypothetical protein
MIAKQSEHTSWIRAGLLLASAAALSSAAVVGCSADGANDEKVGRSQLASDDPCAGGVDEYEVAPGQWVVCVYPDDPPEDPCVTFPEMCTDPCVLYPWTCEPPDPCSADPSACSDGSSGSSGDPGEPPPAGDIPYECVVESIIFNHCVLIRNELCPNQANSEVATFLAEPGYGSVDSQPKAIEVSNWCRNTYPQNSLTPGTPKYAGGNGPGFIYMACCHN